MSAALLAKLKVKNTPKIRESVVVAIPAKRNDVIIKTEIIDKTRTSVIDRDEFMKQIRIKEVATKDTKEPIGPVQPVEPVEPKPKKTKKRFKLMQSHTKP